MKRKEVIIYFIFFRDCTELDHLLISTQITALPACTSISRLDNKSKILGNDQFMYYYLLLDIIRPRRGGLVSQTLTLVLVATRCYSNFSQRKFGPGK